MKNRIFYKLLPAKWYRFFLYSFALGLLLIPIGCLQYIAPLPEEMQNHPPRIEPNGVDPRTIGVSIPQSLDPYGVTIFKVVQASDPDRSDVLYAYWFIDYEGVPQDSSRCGEQSSPSENLKSDLREVEFSCRIGHLDRALKKGERISLELFVVDRKTNINSLLDRDGLRKWPEGSLWSKWVWELRAE